MRQPLEIFKWFNLETDRVVFPEWTTRLRLCTRLLCTARPTQYRFYIVNRISHSSFTRRFSRSPPATGRPDFRPVSRGRNIGNNRSVASLRSVSICSRQNANTLTKTTKSSRRDLMLCSWNVRGGKLGGGGGRFGGVKSWFFTRSNGMRSI